MFLRDSADALSHVYTIMFFLPILLQMKSDFCKMEDEMDLLAMNMAAITDFSGKISNTLQDRRQQITKLSNVHSLLKKLQFLFELPAKLNRFLNAGAYRQVVRFVFIYVNYLGGGSALYTSSGIIFLS